MFAEDARVDPLIEINPALNWHPPSVQLCAGGESEITDLSDDLFEARRRHYIVVHEDQVLLRTI